MKYLILSIFFISLLSCKAQQPQESKRDDQLRPIEIDPSDPARFTFLKKELEGKRIVMLGEKTHSDGSTLKWKTDIIKYLHDSLGYNYLLLERGIYETDRAWREIIEKKDSAVGVLAYLINSWGNELQPYYVDFAHYLENQIAYKNPLYLRGIDIMGGSTYAHAFLIELEAFLKEEAPVKDPSILASFEKFSLRKERVSSYSTEQAMNWMRKVNIDSLNYHGDRIIRFLEDIRQISASGKYDIPLFVKSIRSYLLTYPYLLRKSGKKMEYMGILTEPERDEFIFENVKWYLDNHPQEKFIISMSTLHSTKNMAPLREAYSDYKPIKPVGEYIAEKYGSENVYSISFVCYQGYRRHRISHQVFDVPQAPDGSIEKSLHVKGFAFAYIPLSDTLAFPKAAYNLSLSPIYDKWYTAEWPKINDGIFFIDKMEEPAFKILKGRKLQMPYEFK